MGGEGEMQDEFVFQYCLKLNSPNGKKKAMGPIGYCVIFFGLKMLFL
jgi:hypothetical protein